MRTNQINRILRLSEAAQYKAQYNGGSHPFSSLCSFLFRPYPFDRRFSIFCSLPMCPSCTSDEQAIYVSHASPHFPFLSQVCLNRLPDSELGLAFVPSRPSDQASHFIVGLAQVDHDQDAKHIRKRSISSSLEDLPSLHETVARLSHSSRTEIASSAVAARPS